MTSDKLESRIKDELVALGLFDISEVRGVVMWVLWEEGVVMWVVGGGCGHVGCGRRV